MKKKIFKREKINKKSLLEVASDIFEDLWEEELSEPLSTQKIFNS